MKEENINIKTFVCNPFRENCYLVWDSTGEGVIVDPGCYDDAEYSILKEYIAREKVAVKAIWLTHGHFDHIFGVSRVLRDWKVPVYMDAADKLIIQHDQEYAAGEHLNIPDVSFPTQDIHEGDVLRFGNSAFKVISTPGHTPGGVCYSGETCHVIFTGDTLFAGAIGRTDLLAGDYDKLIVGIMDKIMGLPGDTDVLPGHGPKSSIAEERTNNPFLQPFNEPGEEEDIDWDEDGIELNGNI
jgi:glyoxylase-like metal-dependent hydrolase (beta-lactamase superfamily II)